MAGKGRPFIKGGDPRQNLKGRKPGSRNRFRKADLSKLMDHLHHVFDEQVPGGVEGWLAKMAKSARDRRVLAELMKEARKITGSKDDPLHGRIEIMWSGEGEAPK